MKGHEHSHQWADMADPKTLAALLEALGSISTLPVADRRTTILAYLSFCLQSFGMRTAHVGQLTDTAERIDALVSLPGGCAIDASTPLPLSATFCQYVRATGQPVLIADAAVDPRVSRIAARIDSQIGSYLGVPVFRGDGTLYGSLCVLDPDPLPLTATHAAVMRIVAQHLSPLLEPTASPEAPFPAPTPNLTAVAQTVAHDARSPITVILGNADFLALDPLTPGQAESLAAIRVASGLLTRLLNDLQEAAHDHGHFTLLAGHVDPASLTRQLVAAWQAQAARKGLVLQVRVAADPPKIVGDAQRIQQVLINLVSNALRYTLQGEVRIAVGPFAGGGVEFRVEDTGPGIPPELLEAIWGREVRGTASHPGSGLGLAIVRELVAAMGGSCGCESVVGQGSIFWVRLPAEGPPPRQVPRS